MRACICQFLFARPFSVARYPPFASHDRVHCEASPKGPRSLAGVQSVVLAEEAEAVVEGRAEAGAHRQRQFAWAAGSPERSQWRVCTQAWRPEAQVRQLRPHSHAFTGAEGER